MTRLGDDTAGAGGQADALVAWLLGPVFFGLAAWFVFGSPLMSVPLGGTPPVDRAVFAAGSRRTAMSDPPQTAIAGYGHTCNDCHRLFDSPPVAPRVLMQHTGVVLDHGMNDRCFNCHDERDRELLVLMNGQTLSFAETARLCAQCHGTVYRDWERGTHGKTLGSWDAESGAQRRLRCNECHDPHSPAYEPLRPLPGPSTLRMGDQSVAHDHGGGGSPLRRNRSGSGAHHDETASHEEERP